MVREGSARAAAETGLLCIPGGCGNMDVLGKKTEGAQSLTSLSPTRKKGASENATTTKSPAIIQRENPLVRVSRTVLPREGTARRIVVDDVLVAPPLEKCLQKSILVNFGVLTFKRGMT
jgi:hypothetical protein